MSNEFYQQGDVIFKIVDSIPKNLKKKEDKIVAEGEVTGHMHRVISKEADVLVDKEGNIYLSTEKEATVTHEEHHKITVPPGKYQIGIVREFDPLEETIQEVKD